MSKTVKIIAIIILCFVAVTINGILIESGGTGAAPSAVLGLAALFGSRAIWKYQSPKSDGDNLDKGQK